MKSEILNLIPYRKDDIICVLKVGSNLYLKNGNDLDFKVIIKSHNEDVNEEISYHYKGKDVDFVFYTIEEWNNVRKEKRAYFIQESVDMKCVYGDDSKFKRYDCVNDKKVQEYLIQIYDICLFGKNACMDKKRLWNFLLFAYKYQNHSHRLKRWQIKEIQKAHDLKLDVNNYRWLLNKLKGEILK